MEVTSPDRIMFPEVGVTKGEMVGYYEAISEYLFPWLTGRALTLERYPRGIAQKGFMQKNAADHFPASIERFVVPKADGGDTVYPVVTEAGDIPYLANQGTVSFHIWTSRVDDVEHPDYLVIDLDPEEGDVAGVREAAAVAGEILDTFGVPSLPVASGSKGFHVWAPLQRSVRWERVSVAARAVAGLVAAQLPDGATLEFLKKNRKGRVFVDWMRNHPGASVVSPFSLRPRASASLSMPMEWAELDEAEPDAWTVANIGDRLSHLPDWPSPVELPHDAIESAAREAGVDLDTTIDRFGRER